MGCVRVVKPDPAIAGNPGQRLWRVRRAPAAEATLWPLLMCPDLEPLGAGSLHQPGGGEPAARAHARHACAPEGVACELSYPWRRAAARARARRPP